MYISFAFLSVFLVIFPNLIIIRKINKLGLNLGFSLSFTVLIIILKAPDMIRAIAKVLSNIIIVNQETYKYIQYFFSYQIIYIFGVIITFYLIEKFKLISNLFLPLLSTNLKNFVKKVSSSIKFSYGDLSFLAVFISLIFLCLMVTFSSVGTNWITNTRYAYIQGRTGIGPIWVLYIFSVSLSSYYLGLSMLDSSLKLFKINSLSYILKLIFIFYLAYLSGSKGVFLNTISTQLGFYLLTKSNKFKIFLILKKFISKAKIDKSILIIIVSTLLFVPLIIFLLRGFSLLSYLTESNIGMDHLVYTINNPESFGFPGNLFLNDLFKAVPRFFREILGLPLFSSNTMILEAIYGTQDSNIFKINTPHLDPVLTSINIWGKFYMLGPILSSFFSTLPLALLVHIYKDKYIKKNFIYIFAICLNYFPLINPVLLLNLYSFLP